MEGEALSWMQWWEANSEVLSWSSLKEAVLPRFQPTALTNAFEMLMSLKQEGTVREYRKKFETIASHIKIQDQSLFLGMFSNGLRDDIRAEVRLHCPKHLAEMMDIALLVEEKMSAVSRYGGRGIGGFKNGRTEGYSKPTTDTVGASKNGETGKNALSLNAKSVSSKEIEERRRKGLCFTCEEKYVPGHVFKNKALKLLYVEEVTDEGDEKKEDEEEEIVWAQQ